MEEFIASNKSELLGSAITLLALFLVRFLSFKMVRRIGHLSNIVEARTRLILRYVSFLLSFLGFGVLVFVWGVNFKELGLLFSSVFAVIGVALFAQWSILSNLTSGVILFFSFPFKIGDRIKIMDKDMISGENEQLPIFEIEDITAYHIHLRNDREELITYPNNMLLQKAVTLVNRLGEDSKRGDSL